MTHIETKPTFYLRLLRESLMQLVQPGYALSVGEVITIQKKLNTCFEVTREMEEEFEFLSSVALPEVKPPAPEQRSATVIPLRRKPRLQMIVTSPDGGDAA